MRRLSEKLALALLVFAGTVSIGTRANAQGSSPSDDEIRRLLMQRSIAGYSGNCPCPESINSAGRRCGGSSAYSKPGGSQPLCYPSDVTAEMIQQYRQSIPNTRQ